jgi:hypothetical protein
MLCATLRRRRRSLDSLEDYRLLAPSHRCSSCGRKYSRSKQILSKVRKLISQTGTVLVADWLVDRVVCINRTYHLFVCCCVIVVFVLSLSVKNPLFWQKLADVSEDCCTALKMKVATSSEKSINFYSGTRCLVHNIAVFKPGPWTPQVLSICPSVPGVPGSKAGRYTAYLHWCLSWFPCTLPQNAGLVSEIRGLGCFLSHTSQFVIDILSCHSTVNSLSCWQCH